jgi:hypothetical protein
VIAPSETGDVSPVSSKVAGVAPKVTVTVGVAILLVVVGIGASAHPSGTPVSSHLTSLAGLGDAVGATALVVAIGVFGMLAYAFWPNRRHKSPDDFALEQIKYESNQTRWEAFLDWFKLAVLAGAVLYGLFFVIERITAAPSGGGSVRPPTASGITTTTALTTASSSPSSSVSTGTWEVVAIIAGAAALLVGIVFLLGRLRRPRFASAVHAGRLSDLLNDPDARHAVIRAYAAMERLFARRGRARRADETPFEYVEHSLEQAGAPRDAAIDLTELFEQARFSDHVINTTFRTSAIRALEAVRSGTEVPV